MLLNETIKNSAMAIRNRRMALEQKHDAETYSQALALLAKQDNAIKSILVCIKEMKKQGIVDNSVLSRTSRDDLLAAVNDCGSAISEGYLTTDTVKVLQTKTVALSAQLQIVWKDAAKNYAEGTKGYLAMISGLTADPVKARMLGESISKTVENPLSTHAIYKLVTDVKAAKEITDSFELKPNIEYFLKRVSSQQATAADLTPEVMEWLREKQLFPKLKVRFV